MSPETDEVDDAYNSAISTTSTVASVQSKELKNVVKVSQTQMLTPRKKRERSRTQQQYTRSSPHLCEAFAEQLSPATSSSSTSQVTSTADATFEPTIDMMVNDFDDEQTLNEEEALAALELQDPHDEITTLREESEMPIEELLAKYRSMPIPAAIEPHRKRFKKNKKDAALIKEIQRTDDELVSEEGVRIVKRGQQRIMSTDELKVNKAAAEEDVIVIESGDEEADIDAVVGVETVEEQTIGSELNNDTQQTEFDDNYLLTKKSTTAKTIISSRPMEKVKSQRSHLLDLYPEEYSSAAVNTSLAAVITTGKEIFYGEEEDEDEDDDDEEDDDADTDYVKKTIMVGSAFQAQIPEGLSQYGDVLPYENEDKLVWEPSQVSEREVEQFLLNSRDIKHTLSDEVIISPSCDEEIPSKTQPTPNEINSVSEKDSSCIECVIDTETFAVSQLKHQSNEKKASAATSVCDSSEGDVGGVVKDNEQALHLLVQCGYDFKEALRRKRLNAVPHTGSMSLWSEEECHKFEEGIQKFGKDFVKIRQNQVRTRTMRELVQFYYLWKKSERRDHDFANSDTVDHMDIYLNEGGDYGSNATPAVVAGGLQGGAAATITTSTSPALATRKTGICAQKNISIMTGSIVATPSSSAANTFASQSSAAGAGNKTTTAANRKRNVGSGGLFTNSNCSTDNQIVSASSGTSHSAK